MRRIPGPLYALALAGGVAVMVVFVSALVFLEFFENFGDDAAPSPQAQTPLLSEELRPRYLDAGGIRHRGISSKPRSLVTPAFDTSCRAA